ncbi:transcriptional regulator with XRE-family HTH domain [Litoreibacter meonggei]|uniref:Transcriptional regulator with XRE-family HTH domain n=1 Tax=Litoreibacter meonggei TaxID=1049199 RepID=A0A497X403_9RHOB|nr:helix-turn-helix transcriptional regulator [Litoreibacter meonggei]RLJ59104.1 transcriptional regulator with XRE-family HTH domain [Litoreibacter meonggei]
MLHRKLKEARLGAGLTMEAAAEKLSLTQSTISRIEAGDTGVTSQRLVDLASAYGVSPSALLDGSVVRSMSETDLDRLGMVIEFVEASLADAKPRPQPSQIKDVVVTIFKQETAIAWETGASFDPSRYQDLVALLFKQKGQAR